jgi:tetratricopeptide (TPR) repeat protein
MASSAFLLWARCAVADDRGNQELDRRYQSAVADYDVGRYSEAAEELKKLLPLGPKSFELHELLGLVYASLNQNGDAEEQLGIAVELKPDSAAARTNFGALLLHLGKSSLAADQFLQALRIAPQSYEASHNLGELYVKTGRVGDARPLLELAYRTQPDDYDNAYDLAMADFELGRFNEARKIAQAIAKKQNTGEVQNLLGQVDEKDGNFLEAAHEFETAAHLDPSEDNLFNWGSEMLLHRTYGPAVIIFQQAADRYPHSARLLIGLGLGLYAQGKYDDAVKVLITAADLNPSDPRSYVFLSKAYDSSAKRADEVIERFRRYAQLRPENALAQYYYALCLWKGKRSGESATDLKIVESLLQKAVALDGTIPEAHVQLGELYSDQRAYDKSIAEYLRALELNPNLPDAHYRLGTDYVHAGRKEDAQKEFAVYQKLRAEHLAEVDKERAEVQQFVYSEEQRAVSKF